MEIEQKIKAQAKETLAKHNGNEDRAIEEIAFNIAHSIQEYDEETSKFWVKIAKAMCDGKG